jgi:TatD DNase family protein
VSLNAADAAASAKLCPSKYGEAAYPAVKDFIREAKQVIPEVQATVVGVPDIDREACRKIVEDELGVRFRWRDYNNVG